MLDYGCGSAILGLAALRYGANKAVGVDIDKDALISAKNNCEMNDLNMDLYAVNENDSNLSAEEQSFAMNPLRGATDSFPSVKTLQGEFDLTVANILAPILISLRYELATRTKKGGKIALSGVVHMQAESVMDAFKNKFDDVKVEEIEDQWVIITGVKK